MNHCKVCGNNIPDEVEDCSQAGFGEGCGKSLNTPDTEWEKEFDEKFSFLARAIDFYKGETYTNINKTGKDHLNDIKTFISSRDTYWKERVRKDLDRRLEIQEKVLHSEYEGGYTQALKDVKEAHFTNEDNLK